MQFINLTPHAIVLNSGESFPASGTIARVSANMDESALPSGHRVFKQTFGEVTGIPAAEEGTTFIVSALVLAALAGSRADVVAPATGHKEAMRDEAGRIVAVPGFVV